LRLLLINPNTSAHITARLATSARQALAAGDRLSAVTANQGPAVVRTAEGLREAGLSAMAMATAHAADHDAIVLGISLDGAAPGLRERFPWLPVVGMTEAALLTACLRSSRIGVVTLGASMMPLYWQRITEVGVASRVVGVEAPEAPAAFEAGAAEVSPAVLDCLADASERLRRDGAQAIVLAGAVLCGYAQALQARAGLPVFDGVGCAVRQARLQLESRAAA
jgi:allantoin racemase